MLVIVTSRASALAPLMPALKGPTVNPRSATSEPGPLYTAEVYMAGLLEERAMGEGRDTLDAVAASAHKATGSRGAHVAITYSV